jgi:hypothetical protein
VGALVAFARVTQRQHGTMVQRRRAWVALGCVLVLLFFAISMTDDLHQDVAFIEEGRSSKRHSGALHADAPGHQAHAAIHSLATMAAVSRGFIEIPLRFAAFLSVAVVDHYQSWLPSPAAGRAPPLNFL